MLTRTATRRSAAVLMMALVAMLLVATGGSARATHARVSAGTGHVSASPQVGRHVAAVPPSAHDHTQLHLDLASTAPSDDAPQAQVVDDAATGAGASVVTGDVVTPVGRAPPAL